MSRRFYYDFEFIQRAGGLLSPISMGMVDDAGRELYLVNAEMDTLTVASDWWLMKNVMNSIAYEEVTSHVTGTGQPVKDLYIWDDDAYSLDEWRRKILKFVGDDRPQWWAWMGAADHRLLNGLFGDFTTQPAHWPFLTMDVGQEWERLGQPDLPVQPPGKHNALEDAKHVKVKYDWLRDYEWSKVDLDEHLTWP